MQCSEQRWWSEPHSVDSVQRAVVGGFAPLSSTGPCRVAVSGPIHWIHESREHLAVMQCCAPASTSPHRCIARRLFCVALTQHRTQFQNAVSEHSFRTQFQNAVLHKHRSVGASDRRSVWRLLCRRAGPLNRSTLAGSRKRPASRSAMSS